MRRFDVLSNYAYAVLGLAIAALQRTPTAYALGAALVNLSIGSALYHATRKRWAADLDVSAMYALGAALSLRLLPLGDITAAIMLAGAIAAGYLFRFKVPGKMEHKVGALFTPAFLVPAFFMSDIDAWMAVLALVLFFAAYLARQSGKPWGHGAWHLLAAAMIGVLAI